MSLFKILPTDRSFAPVEIEASNPARVLATVQESAFKEADVLQDNTYAFSLRLDANGIWSVFQHEAPRRAS